VDQIIKALKGIEAVVVKPEPTAIITGYTGNSITLTVRYWIANRQLSTISEVMYTLRTILPNADLAIVEPAGNI
jgi:small-conductance mechanosensitive channel